MGVQIYWYMPSHCFEYLSNAIGPMIHCFEWESDTFFSTPEGVSSFIIHNFNRTNPWCFPYSFVIHAMKFQVFDGTDGSTLMALQRFLLHFPSVPKIYLKKVKFL